MNNKWFGFLAFIWITCMFLGSTFERQGAVAEGQTYSTGSATFTTGSTVVTGSGTSWVSGMAGGVIKLNADNSWKRIVSVEDTENLTLPYSYSPAGGSGAYTMMPNPAWSGESGETTLEYLADLRHITYQEGEVGMLAWLTPNPVYFETVIQVVTWDFTFLRGEGYEMIRWIILLPFSVAIIFGLFYGFIQLMMGFIR